jgi:hypothetical protein
LRVVKKEKKIKNQAKYIEEIETKQIKENMKNEEWNGDLKR